MTDKSCAHCTHFRVCRFVNADLDRRRFLKDFIAPNDVRDDLIVLAGACGQYEQKDGA